MKLKYPANILAIILINALFISSCSTSQPIRTKMQQLRVGMTQEQVTQLLERKPDKRNFHQESEEWIYQTFYFGYVSNEYKIGFKDGRVVSFDDGSTHSTQSPRAIHTSPSHIVPNTIVANEEEIKQNNWFKNLEKQLTQDFSSERISILKRNLYKKRYITVLETKAILNLFPFQNERWEALKLCIPIIDDFEDLSPILEFFPFSSDRKTIKQWVNKEIELRIASRRIIYR